MSRKTILIIVASAAAMVLVGAVLIYINQFNVYQDSQYHYKIKFPSQWRMVSHPQPNVGVVFISPKETALDALQENLNVTIQPVPAEIATLASFSVKIKEQMIAVFGTGITIAEDVPYHWGPRPGHKLVIDAAKPDHLRMVTVWTIKGDQAYILTFIGDMNKYKTYGPLVDRMIASFQLQ